MSVLQQIMTLIQKHYYKMGDIPKAINQEYLGEQIEAIIAKGKSEDLPDDIATYIQSQLVPSGVCDHGYDNTTDRLCDDLHEIEY